ncbi:MAG: hypothetical protein IPM32_16805 [Ignavibacteriae bacterium]|nr:hypothetical protein [Ignavibacteriota bacterium]
MEKTTIFNSRLLINENSDDFISKTLFEEDQQIKDDVKKRKLTLIGLGSLYIVLILISFTLLS